MAGMVLPVISSAVRSPWFRATRALTTAYGDHEGRLTPVAFDRPVADEYRVLRTRAGIFDVPEVPLEIRGPDAAAFLDYVFTRPVSTLAVNRGRYGLMCHHGGGIACDGVVFRLAEDWFWYVHADRDVFTWLQALSPGHDVDIRDPGAWAIQVQGPTSLEILDACVDGGAPDGFKYYHARQVTMGGQPVLISRTGWTAELGFEVYNMDRQVDGMALWSHLMAAGAPHGLEILSTYAMNPRRIEAGIMNYGTDMGWDTTPFDLGLGSFVDFGHDFIGRDALHLAERKPRFSGFRTEAGDVKWGAPVSANGKAVGRVKAFERSPTLGAGIGYVLFDAPEAMLASAFSVTDRTGNEHPLSLHDLPFFDPDKRIPRGLEVMEFKG
ncbi:MAG: aminomethyltransferase family protein [Pseudomonadota bacterium]